MSTKKILFACVAVMLVAAVALAACGGSETTTTGGAGTTTEVTAAPTTGGGAETTASSAGSETTAAGPAAGAPIKLGFDEGFTGFMAYDASIAEKGILTALAMLNNQAAGHPLEYVKEDNGSDPVVAVDKARKMVESDKISVMLGPVFSPSAAAVTDYLAKSSGIPQISIVIQPKDNLETANKLAFMPNGLYGAQGYEFGKYCAAQLGYKTVNAIHYDDTASRELQMGFERGFAEGGGTISSVKFVPGDVVDFSSYLTSLPKADATFFWIFGNGSVPFVKQYHDYGLTAQLLTPLAQNFSDEQLAELGDISTGIIGFDYYAWTLDNPANKEFVAAYQKLYPDDHPNSEVFGGWQAVMMFTKALEATGGDATPSKIIAAMGSLSIDTPAGKVTIGPYQDAYIGTRDYFVVKSVKLEDGTYTWTPVYTLQQVQLGE